MRNLLITSVLALVGMFNAAAMNDDGHVLTDLWRKYEDARKADRPQKEAEILADIKKQALREHLPVDFYDAATEYVNTVQRRDWKQGNQLREDLEAEVRRFDYPLVTFLWMRQWKHSSTDELWAYVKDHSKGFQGRNPALYRGVDVFLNGTLKPFIRNDKEFVLWNLLQSRRYADAVQDELYQELKKELAGSYPGDGALEYYVISRKYTLQREMPAKKAALQALQEQYAEKALGLYPAADLLLMEKEELDQYKASSPQYKELRLSCLRFESQRKAFRGDEATLAKGCTGVEYLLQELEGQNLSLQVDSTSIMVLFKNLYHANVTLRQGKTTVKTWKVVNFDESFYVQDTVAVDLPELPDGNYTVEARSGKHTAQENYTQFTLSLATRQDARGRSVYVTDYKTGKPLPFVTIRLMKGDQEVANTSLRLDGFTPLPATFENQMNGRSYYSLEAVYGERRSPLLGISRSSNTKRDDINTYCNIYLDRGAYNPGDEVRFKAVVYEGSPSRGMKVCAGKKVSVKLKDSEDNVLETRELEANDWGSVSGAFNLPVGLRGGSFEIEVKGLASRMFRVDEFVLPCFDVTFDPVKELYLPGSEVPVTGSVQSYSGHPLTGARVSIQVSRYGNVVLEQEQRLKADNRFAFTFPTQEGGFYEAEVKVTDRTGETLEFHNAYYIETELRISTRVQQTLDVNLAMTKEDYRLMAGGRSFVVGAPVLSVVLQALDGAGNEVPVPVSYKLLRADGTLLSEGTVASGETLHQTLPANGIYLLKSTVSASQADGTAVSTVQEDRILCILPDDDTIGPEVKHIFLPGQLSIGPSQGIEARLGTGAGRVYAVATLFGEERSVLDSRQLVVEDGQIASFQFPYLNSYPDAVRLLVFYFKEGEAMRMEREYRRAKDKFDLPLSFTRFQDKAYPGTQYTFSIKTQPGVEVLAAAWDKSLDAIEPNYWPMVNMRDYSVEYVPLNSVCGMVEGSGRWTRGFGRVMMASKAVNAVAMDGMVLEDAVAVEEAEALPMPEGAAAPDEGVKARVDFSSALTFQPHLYPKADGTLDFSFRTSDKLSTFYVRVFAHGKAMHNALCEGEMVVSLPVKVSLLEPRFLYEGDVYEAAVTVSSVAEVPVSGVVVLRAGDSVQQISVTVAPRETVTKRFKVAVPSSSSVISSEVEKSLTLKASFIASEFTDAVQVTVPVYPAAQQLTEAHSAVLRDAMSRNALLAELRSRFVNVPASQATLKEITVLDMVKDAIPSHIEPCANDVLSLSEAWYIRLMASQLSGEGDSLSSANNRADAPEEVSSSESTEELLEKILSCRNGDGGFGWFEGMPSNAIISAVLLERFALLRDRGFDIPDMSATVKFLDNKQFGTSFPYWCGWVSDAQYMRVRALYSEVPFEVKPVSAADKKRLSQFKKDAKAYLTPSKKEGRGLEGQILAKARRLLTLRSLAASPAGLALAKEWGIGLSSKIEQSIQADITSLLEYAVEHRDGGWYYPNAVMPFRGLLENEAYAHALLCQLLSEEGNAPASANNKADAPAGASPSVIADGIRLWLMLQKETQHWDTEPAFIDAITAILDGSEAVLNTRVLALSATYEAPFQAIQATGNGFTVERKFFREVVEERQYDDKTGPNDYVAQWVPLVPGERVEVGEKIRVEYAIWNAENRSFVKLTAGREASLQPVQQLSGHLGWGILRPLRSGVSWTFTPNGYRNVKASATEFYFDSYPEENTVLAEEFFVTQAGRFVAPVTVIESLYAPHYCANSAFRAPLLSAAE